MELIEVPFISPNLLSTIIDLPLLNSIHIEELDEFELNVLDNFTNPTVSSCSPRSGMTFNVVCPNAIFSKNILNAKRSR